MGHEYALNWKYANEFISAIWKLVNWYRGTTVFVTWTLMTLDTSQISCHAAI